MRVFLHQPHTNVYICRMKCIRYCVCARINPDWYWKYCRVLSHARGQCLALSDREQHCTQSLHLHHSLMNINAISVAVSRVPALILPMFFFCFVLFTLSFLFLAVYQTERRIERMKGKKKNNRISDCYDGNACRSWMLSESAYWCCMLSANYLLMTHATLFLPEFILVANVLGESTEKRADFVERKWLLASMTTWKRVLLAILKLESILGFCFCFQIADKKCADIYSTIYTRVIWMDSGNVQFVPCIYLIGHFRHQIDEYLIYFCSNNRENLGEGAFSHAVFSVLCQSNCWNGSWAHFVLEEQQFFLTISWVRFVGGNFIWLDVFGKGISAASMKY